MSFCWTDETLQTARHLYLEEGLSASESARRLGTTRSALISKAHRMGWAEERDPGLPAANQLRAGRALARTLRAAQPRPLPQLQFPPEAGPVLLGSKPKPWMKRLPGECAFPVAGDGEAVISCCAPSGRRGYCETHVGAMYMRRTPTQQKALERIAEWVDRLELRTPRPVEAR